MYSLVSSVYRLACILQSAKYLNSCDLGYGYGCHILYAFVSICCTYIYYSHVIRNNRPAGLAIYVCMYSHD